jgi:hypothetical protein
MSTPVRTPVGLADSELKGYVRQRDRLIVTVRAWNNTILSFTFEGTIGLRDVLAAEFSTLVEAADASSDFLSHVLAQYYESVPVPCPYRVYSFLNNDDESSLDVVALECHCSINQASS